MFAKVGPRRFVHILTFFSSYQSYVSLQRKTLHFHGNVFKKHGDLFNEPSEALTNIEFTAHFLLVYESTFGIKQITKSPIDPKVT